MAFLKSVVAEEEQKLSTKKHKELEEKIQEINHRAGELVKEVKQYETEGETLAETEVSTNHKRQKLKNCQNFALEFNAIVGCNNHTVTRAGTCSLLFPKSCE